MKQFADFVPVLLFVVVYYTVKGSQPDVALYYATAALMISVTLQIIAMRVLARPITQTLKITFWVSIVLGGLTLLLRDKTFIQWKPTIVNWVFAVALIASQYIGQRNLLERALGEQLKLPAVVWRRLNYAWATGFALLGALNLYVVYHFSEAFWVNFKFLGIFGITFLYAMATIFYLHRRGHLDIQEDSKRVEPRQ